MNEATKYRMKAFLWDQFVRPVYIILNLHQLKGILLALLILSIIIFKSNALFLFTSSTLVIIFSYEIYKYYKSGEFMKNYRHYKYKDYKKATKAFKQEAKKSLNTLNSLNSDAKEAETQGESSGEKQEESAQRKSEDGLGTHSSTTGQQKEI